MSRFSKIGVMGAGAWGTALAQVATMAGHKVVLKARETEVYETINARHTNDLFLKDVPLSRDITAVNDMAGLSECDLVLAVPPAQHMRASLEAFKPHMRPGATIVLCSKGVERGSDMLMHHVLKDVLPEAQSAVLAGPSFASEVARGLPAAVTVACEDEALAEAIACALAGPTFRPYLSHDMVGAEAGGAIKNVLAIACGISEGRGLGKNAHAALITRGFAEMSRLAVALGAQYETMAGLCGLGDLVLTCSSTQSRNMSVGMAMGQGKTLAEALEGKLSVAEGVQSAPAVTHLGKALGVDLPICNAVNAVLNGDITVDEAISRLMTRPIKAERH